MTNILNLATFLLKKISPNPDSLEIGHFEPNENAVIVEVKAPKEDIPFLIGKNGLVIKSVRNILRILSLKENKFIDIKVEEK